MVDQQSGWVIEEPGLIRLAGTKMRIQLMPGTSIFAVLHDGVNYGSCNTLNGAKAQAVSVVNDLLLVGIDP